MSFLKMGALRRTLLLPHSKATRGYYGHCVYVYLLALHVCMCFSFSTNLVNIAFYLSYFSLVLLFVRRVLLLLYLIFVLGQLG